MKRIISKLAMSIHNWAHNVIYLDRLDFIDLGFKIENEGKRYSTYSKGKYRVTFEPQKMFVSVKYGRMYRHSGVVETKDEFVNIMKRINKYFKKK